MAGSYVNADVFGFSIHNLSTVFVIIEDSAIKICYCDTNWNLIQDGPQLIVVHGASLLVEFPGHGVQLISSEVVHRIQG